MLTLQQTPPPGTCLRAHVGDVLTLTLAMSEDRPGQALVRTNLGWAALHRREIVESTDAGRPVLARDWHDLPMDVVAPGLYRLRLPLLEVGVFAAKACFVPEGERGPLWPPGGDLTLKTAPAYTCAANSVYTAFPRQFGPHRTLEASPAAPNCLADLDAAGYAVIPPSGTFRDLAAHLDTILGELRFRILQLLPIHPVPTTFARMGRFGSPFAGLDFLAVDPALAVFDPTATPLDQFRELLDAVHARGARLFLDLPANHTGWASTLQNHHPDWFRRTNGDFHSPGAWGVVWEDLVELDYRHLGLRDFMAGVFEFWCREGVDGFRCDAGYMIPAEVWTYIVARVRSQFPDTVFLLEGLGGKISVTRTLLDAANLDWAYSELFQTEDRRAFEQHLPGALALSAEVGPLVHFAETHDNLRLAARSSAYARMRVALAALTSHNGAFGVTNGVEWFATERLDVHGASALRWGHEPNLLVGLRRLNALLATHPAFGPDVSVRLIQVRDGNTLAILRTPATAPELAVLALVNLDPDHAQPVHWPVDLFDLFGDPHDLLGGPVPNAEHTDGLVRMVLEPAQVLCVSRQGADSATLDTDCAAAAPRVPACVHHQELRAAALRVRSALTPRAALSADEDADQIAAEFGRDPLGFIERWAGADRLAPVSVWRWPQDARRVAPIPPGHLLLIEAPDPFQTRLATASGTTLARHRSLEIAPGRHIAVYDPLPQTAANQRCRLFLCVFERTQSRRSHVDVLVLHYDGRPKVRTTFTGSEVRATNLLALLTNGRGAMSHVPARWPELRSRYDALLAANPDPRVPCDRQVLFTRCRVWLRHRGYSQYVDAACLDRFATTPGTGVAEWEFKVPVGLGRWAPLSLRLRLEPGANSVVLTVLRPVAPDGDAEVLANSETVRVVLRPDIESRSFHDVTKAYTGPEHAWRAALRPHARSVSFLPEGRPGLLLHSDRCVFVHDPEWQYTVPRPLEAERGLDAASDLFSPGYFHVQLRGGESLRLSATMEPDEAPAPAVGGEPGSRSFGDALALATVLPLALQDFIVRRDDLQTVIAGYPWFLDWGRDTFIVLRGMIVAGMTDTALAVLREFGRFERGGTLPNMIRGNDDANRDTSDAPLWYAVAARDLVRAVGPSVLGADCGGRPLTAVLTSLATGYRDGTANGIRMDAASALVFSPAHFTWMDTNYPAGTPREGYPVEIQALWIATLRFLAQVLPAGGWGELAERARASLRQLFWREGDGFLSDCLHAAPGVPAATAVADDHLRCNQLFALTLGALDDPALGRRILRACETLLVPGAIRTLADRPVSVPLPVWRDGQLLNDPQRPYWGRYDGDEDTRRKPAYHNGTAWTWVFPSYAEALVAVCGPTARPAALALLGSGTELLEDGAVGHLSEILDGDAPHAQRGCDAQAWGVSEFLRVATLLG